MLGGDTLLFKVLLAEQLTWNIPLLGFFFCIFCLYGFLSKRKSISSFLSLQPLLFIIGLTLLYVMIGSPLTPISHLSFSFHMIQMSVLYFIIPPLLLLGIPESLYDKINHLTNFKKVKIKWIPPNLALYMFAGLFLLYHLPIVLQLLSQHAALQSSYIYLLFSLSFSMWWPIASPKVKQRLSTKQKKQYTFLSGWLIMPACLLFIITAFVDGGNNPFIAELTVHLCMPADSNTFTVLPPPFNTKYDQITAGICMMGLHKLGLMMTLRIEKSVSFSMKNLQSIRG